MLPNAQGSYERLHLPGGAISGWSTTSQATGSKCCLELRIFIVSPHKGWLALCFNTLSLRLSIVIGFHDLRVMLSLAQPIGTPDNELVFLREAVASNFARYSLVCWSSSIHTSCGVYISCCDMVNCPFSCWLLSPLSWFCPYELLTRQQYLAQSDNSVFIWRRFPEFAIVFCSQKTSVPSCWRLDWLTDLCL